MCYADLMEWAEFGNTDMVRQAVEAGVAGEGDCGKTALMNAAEDGHTECVKLLLHEAGKVDDNGETALMLAANEGHSDCAKLLYDLPQELNGNTKLIIAAQLRWMDEVRANLKDADKTDSEGWTALMAAAYGGSVECTKLFLSQIGKRDAENWTALMSAAQNGHTECVKLLLQEAGMADSEGWTALVLASFNNKRDCLKLLLSEIGQKSSDGESVLVIASLDESNVDNAPFELLLAAGERDQYVHPEFWTYSQDNPVFARRLMTVDAGLVKIQPGTARHKVIRNNPILMKRNEAVGTRVQPMLQQTAHLRWLSRLALLQRTAFSLQLQSIRPKVPPMSSASSARLKKAAFAHMAQLCLSAVLEYLQ